MIGKDACLDWEQSLESFLLSELNITYTSHSIRNNFDIFPNLLPNMELVALRSILTPYDSFIYDYSYIDHCNLPIKELDGVSPYSYHSRWKELYNLIHKTNKSNKNNKINKNKQNHQIHFMKCYCIRCIYESRQISNKKDDFHLNDILKDYKIIDIIDLGNFYMQQNMYQDARTIYRYVIIFIEKTLEDHTSLSSNVISNNSYDIPSEYVLLLDQLGNYNMIHMLRMIVYLYLHDL